MEKKGTIIMISVTEEKNSTKFHSFKVRNSQKKTRNRKKFPPFDENIYKKPKSSIIDNGEIVDAPTSNLRTSQPPSHFYLILY